MATPAVLPYADELAAVVAYLRADAAVIALCGNPARVFGAELPREEAASMPRAAVVVNDSGFGSGGGALGMANNSYLPLGSSTKDLRCYGATLAQARAVWNACARALKDLGLDGRTVITLGDGSRVMLYDATPAAPATTREPEVNWPLSFGTFNLTAAENAV